MSNSMTQHELEATFEPERFPYGSSRRYHLQHIHLFASDLDKSITFYTTWFDGEVAWDGAYAGSRNVFMKIGVGALHFYEQQPRDLGRNAVHHLGIQVVGLEDLYDRMGNAGIELRKPIQDSNGSKYFMLEAPDGVLLELFEPGADREKEARNYYGFPG